MKEPDFYVRPFHTLDYDSKVYDMKRNVAFEFINVSREEQGKILYRLNAINKDTEEIPDYNPLLYSPSTTSITRNHGEQFISIRGWGNLTGTGGYKFSDEKASKIQDDFANWLVERLTISI
jgi:hypothetical protein